MQLQSLINHANSLTRVRHVATLRSVRQMCSFRLLRETATLFIPNIVNSRVFNKQIELSLLQNECIDTMHLLEFCSHSERRCSKTATSTPSACTSIALTQNVAAPKPLLVHMMESFRFALTQNVAAPKLRQAPRAHVRVLLSLRTSLLQNNFRGDLLQLRVLLSLRTSLLQNLYPVISSTVMVLLSLRTSLLQNSSTDLSWTAVVLLSLRTSLLQNPKMPDSAERMFCSHSERRCSKTWSSRMRTAACVLLSLRTSLLQNCR